MRFKNRTTWIFSRSDREFPLGCRCVAIFSHNLREAGVDADRVRVSQQPARRRKFAERLIAATSLGSRSFRMAERVSAQSISSYDRLMSFYLLHQ